YWARMRKPGPAGASPPFSAGVGMLASAGVASVMAGRLSGCVRGAAERAGRRGDEHASPRAATTPARRRSARAPGGGRSAAAGGGRPSPCAPPYQPLIVVSSRPAFRGASQGMPVPVQIQIVIFAVIAAVVLFQLYNVLGKRVGRQPEEDARA